MIPASRSRGVSVNGKPTVSKTVTAGSTPATPVMKEITLRTWVMLFVLASVMLTASYVVLLPHHARPGVKHVVVSSGMGSRMIGTFLKKEGVIGSKWAFVTYVSLTGQASALKPGTYEFPDTAAIPAITHDLVAGESRERTIIIPEGWGNADIAEYFELQGVASRNETVRFFKSPPAGIVSLLEPLGGARRSSGTEGYLFPDTYRIFRNASLADITRKMLKNFDTKITPELREEIMRQKKTIFEIVVMASLIEKEVVSDSDRTLVSGVLYRRLASGIPLQVDATIVYIKNFTPTPNFGVGAGESRIKNLGNGRVSTEDTKINSSYNTYRYRGLPPGPIANPGLSAIRAAIYPKASPYLYYLSAPDGRTIFSRTLEEHNAAKAKYLQ